MSEATETTNALEPRGAEDLEAAFERAKSEPIKFSGIDIFKLGEVMAKSGYFEDVKDAARAVVKMLAGQELGVGPFTSLSEIDIVNGRPNLSANLLAALIKRSTSYTFRELRNDDEGCELEFFQRTAKGWTRLGSSVFTKRDAIAAGLAGKDVYKKFPRNMFFARALTNGARWYCSDVFVGSVEILEDLDLPAPELLASTTAARAPAERQENGRPPDDDPWLVLPQVKMNILRLWERARGLGIGEDELREFLSTYGCTSRKQITPEQAADFVAELSRLINEQLKKLKTP
jgi:hypothetical protein